MMADKELYRACAVEVKRQIWQDNQALFGDEVSPLLKQYIVEKESALFSTELSVLHNFFSPSPKTRRQGEVRWGGAVCGPPWPAPSRPRERRPVCSWRPGPICGAGWGHRSTVPTCGSRWSFLSASCWVTWLAFLATSVCLQPWGLPVSGSDLFLVQPVFFFWTLTHCQGCLDPSVTPGIRAPPGVLRLPRDGPHTLDVTCQSQRGGGSGVAAAGPIDVQSGAKADTLRGTSGPDGSPSSKPETSPPA